MEIENAVALDAEALSALAVSAARELRETDFSAEGWLNFLNSVSAVELTQKINNPAFSVLRCSAQGRILGFIALKDSEKVDQLFVSAEARKQGVATLLWQSAKAVALHSNAAGRFWVRSSSMAIPVYQRFGFVSEGERASFNGIAFQLMKLSPGP